MRKAVLIFTFLCISFLGFAQVTMTIGDGGFLFKEGTDSICFYQRTPKDIHGDYARSNYIHPLYGLDGTVLTEDFPEDHLHQRGIFWAWHQVYIKGQRIGDPWMLTDFKQTVKNVEFQQLKSGDATFTTEVDWSSPLFKNGEAYMKETVEIHFFLKEKEYRRIDFEIKLKALTDGVTLGGSEDEKGYGGFSARLKLPQDVVFTGENGPIEPQNTSVAAGEYVDITGSMGRDSTIAGVAIVCDPKNPGFPESWILRKSKSMQNVAYPGKTPVEIKQGKPLTLRYSLLIHDDELNKRIIQRVYKK